MQKNNANRIVIDTNLWISFIISKKFPEIDKLLFDNKAKLLFSAELIEEIKATIEKPKLQKYFGANALEEMMDVFDCYIEYIEVRSRINICRDKKDNFLLALAKDGKADVIVTGDQDLIVLDPFEQTRIITISDFKQLIK